MPHQSVSELKQQAKRLREGLATMQVAIGHGQALELVARQHGCRDWNTLQALAQRSAGDAGVGAHSTPAPDRSNAVMRPPAQVGQRVTGAYLGQAFSGTVTGLQELAADRYRVALAFDEPVDVVTFESFSAFRSRISATINQEGSTAEKTSNGVPQLVLDL